VDATLLVADLARREVMHLPIEGGGEVAVSFLEAGLGIADLIDAPRLADVYTRRMGDDLMFTGRLPAGDHG
jgi:hypothetical protein